MGRDEQGHRIFMPMIGLGTGFNDCDHGRHLTAKDTRLTSEKCNSRLPAATAGWISRLQLVDIADLYGTEASIGLALQESRRSRNDVFISTKLPDRAAWPLWGISKGIDLLEEQLKALRTPYVDALLLHQDFFNLSEWKSLEEAADQGKTRIVGVSSAEQASEVQRCNDRGECRKNAKIAQLKWSPCKAHRPEQ